MKHTNFLYVIAIALILINNGCSKPSPDTPYNPVPERPSGCSSADSSIYQASVNGFDFTPGSPYYNQVVVNFKFIQSETTCPSSSSTTDLVLKNLTNNTISFVYNIVFHLNYVTWNYQNAIVIAPLASVDIGQINTNPARIDLGSISIQGSNITYY